MSNKDNTTLFAALAVGAAYYLTKPKAAAAAPTKGASVPGGAQEIFVPGNDNGWRYFTDGTAISPDGTYYKGGQMIWNPMM